MSGSVNRSISVSGLGTAIDSSFSVVYHGFTRPYSNMGSIYNMFTANGDMGANG